MTRGKRWLALLGLLGLAAVSLAQVPNGGPMVPSVPFPLAASNELADCAPSTSCRSNIGLDPSVSTTDGWGAAGNAISATFVACYTNNGSFCGGQAFNIVSFPTTQNGSQSTTVTGTLGGSVITLQSGWCRSEMAGSPIYIPGAGLGGAPLFTKIVSCISTQPSVAASIETPMSVVPSGTVTVSYGAQALNGGTGWQQTDVGKGIYLGNSAGGQLGGTFTITAVTSGLNITLSSNVSSINNSTASNFVWGTDDSTAVSNACAAAAAIPSRQLQVPLKHFVPSLSAICYNVRLRGSGALMSTEFGLPVSSGAGAGIVQEFVVPYDAPPAQGPRREVIAARDLNQCRLAGPNPIIVQSGDSLEQLVPNELSGLGTYPGSFKAAFLRQNQRTLWPTFRNAAAGGAQYTNFDGNPNQATGDVLTSTSTPWLTQIAAVNPCLVINGMGNNDGAGLSIPALVDSYVKMTTPGAVFATPPDFIYVTHHPYSRINNSNIDAWEGDEYASGYICSFAHVMGRPCIDGAREGEKHLFGIDPGAMRMTRRYDVPYNTNNMALPYSLSGSVYGHSAQFFKSGQNGATFWANFTGNGGVTDPRGNFIAFRVGKNSDNVVWLFYNGTNIGYECDPSAGLPGLGCDGPNGQPPVVPSLLSNVTVANTGGGGVAQVSTSTAVLQPCTVGGTVAIPGAGAVLTPPGYTSYTAPLVTTVTACNSTSLMTLAVAATTTYAAQSGFVMFGNPVTYSNVTDASNCTNEPFGFEVNFDTLRVWFCSTNQIVYEGPVMRPRGLYQPSIFTGGNRPSFTVGVDINGGTTFQTLRPNPSQITFNDAEVSGPASNGPLSNQTYSGPDGGDGNNHNTMRFGTRVIAPLFDAQDLSIAPAYVGPANKPALGLGIPQARTMALFGDSIFQGNDTINLSNSSCSSGNCAATLDGGYGTFASAYSGYRVLRVPNTGNCSLNGSTSAIMVNYVSCVLALRPDVVMMEIGGNDAAGSTACATVTATNRQIYKAFMQAGIAVIKYGVYPRGGGSAFTTAQANLAQCYNLEDKRFAEGVGNNGFYFVDLDPLYVSPGGGTTWTINTNCLKDLFHPGTSCASAGGYAGAQIINQLFPPGRQPIFTNADVYDGTNNPGGNLLPNGILTGSGGSAPTSGCTGSTVNNSSLTGNNLIGTTCAGSTQTLADGRGAQIITVGGTGSGSNGFLSWAMNSATPSSVAIGDVLEAECWLNLGANSNIAAVDVQMQTIESSTLFVQHGGSVSTLTLPMPSAGYATGTWTPFRTPRRTMTAIPTVAGINIGFSYVSPLATTVSGTLGITSCSLRKVLS